MFQLKLIHRGLILVMVPLLCEIIFVISVVNLFNSYGPVIEEEGVAKEKWAITELLTQSLIDTSASAMLFSKTRSPSVLQHYQKVKEFASGKCFSTLVYFITVVRPTMNDQIVVQRLGVHVKEWCDCAETLIKGEDCGLISSLYKPTGRKQWSEIFADTRAWPIRFMIENNAQDLIQDRDVRTKFWQQMQLVLLLYLLIVLVSGGALGAFFYFTVDRKIALLSDEASATSGYPTAARQLLLKGEIAETSLELQNLLRSRVELEKFERDLTNIVGTELQVPLTTLQSMLYMLSNSGEDLDERSQKALERAEQNISWLIKLTNDLLDLETVRSGAKPLMMIEFSLRTMLERAVQIVQPLAAQENVIVDLYGTDGTVRGDFDVLINACANVLSSAIRASALGGKIVVDYEGTVTGALVKISDSGTGVPESIKDKIFELFQIQPDRILTEDLPSGLELPLAHAMITQHGGEISLESIARRGCTYTWKLNNNPLKAGSGEEALPALLSSKGRRNDWR